MEAAAAAGSGGCRRPGAIGLVVRARGARSSSLDQAGRFAIGDAVPKLEAEGSALPGRAPESGLDAGHTRGDPAKRAVPGA